MADEEWSENKKRLAVFEQVDVFVSFHRNSKFGCLVRVVDGVSPKGSPWSGVQWVLRGEGVSLFNFPQNEL